MVPLDPSDVAVEMDSTKDVAPVSVARTCGREASMDEMEVSAICREAVKLEIVEGSSFRGMGPGVSRKSFSAAAAELDWVAPPVSLRRDCATVSSMTERSGRGSLSAP